MRAAVVTLAISAILGILAPPATPGPGPQEIRLIWVQTSNHPNGKRRSWTSTVSNEIRQFGKPAGAKVGGEVGFSNGPQLVGAIKLPGGVLEYSGKVKHLPRHAGIVLPVVDGSGSFAGVKGTYTRSDGDASHPDDTIVVLRLSYG